MEPNLARIPSELFFKIVAPLPRSDLKSLRLLSRTLRNVASSRMFETISVRDDPASLRQLKNISENPFWASQVQHIEWTPCDFTNAPAETDSRVFQQQGEYIQMLRSIKTVQFMDGQIRGWFGSGRPLPSIFPRLFSWGLQPSVVKAIDLSLYLMYDSAGYIKDVCFHGNIPKSGDSGLAQKNDLDRGIGTWLLFVSVVVTPSKITMNGILLDTIECWSIFFQHPNLVDLRLINVTLASSLSDFKDPLEAILDLFEERAGIGSSSELKGNMVNMYKEGCHGTVSISDVEISRWIKALDSPWLSEKQASFRKDAVSWDMEDSDDDDISFLTWSSETEEESEAERSEDDEGDDLAGHSELDK